MTREEKVNEIIDERKFGVYYNDSEERWFLNLILLVIVFMLAGAEKATSIIGLSGTELTVGVGLAIVSFVIYEFHLIFLKNAIAEEEKMVDVAVIEGPILIIHGFFAGLLASSIFIFIPDSSVWLTFGYIVEAVIILSCLHRFTLYTGSKSTLGRETLALEVNSRLDEIEKKQGSHSTQSILEVPSEVACLHKADYLVLIDKFKNKGLVLSRESELCLLVIDDMNRIIDSSPLDESIEKANETKARAISALIDDLNHHEAIEQELLLISDANATLDKIISRKDD